jgi:oligogalacturonide transport system substrate-binding protein
MFGRPALMVAVARHSPQAQLAARLVGFLLTSDAAARVLGRTRGAPAARGPFELLLREGQWPALEQRAFDQIKRQRDAGRIDIPNPLFEHARMQRFMREVFETVAYDKASDDEAARRLVEEGNALLRRIA